MNNTDIILVGAGGHCSAMIDVIEAAGRFTIKGIIDKPELVGKEVLGYKVIGTDDDLESLITPGLHFHITVGHIRSNAARVRLFGLIKAKGGSLPPIVSPTAYVSPHAVVGEGSAIMHRAFVNAGVTTGANCIINTGSVIEHGCTIGDHCHVSTGACINGDCTIGAHSFIGSHATIIQGLTVGSHVLIAAGAVLTSPAETYGMYAGNPATLKKKLL